MKALLALMACCLCGYGAVNLTPPKQRKEIVHKGAFKAFVNLSNPKNAPVGVVWTNITFRVPYDGHLWMSYQTPVWGVTPNLWWHAGPLFKDEMKVVPLMKTEPMMFFKVIRKEPPWIRWGE